MTEMNDLTCPQCAGHDFTLWKSPHPLIMHWKLNPGLAFNELVLGQRLPNVQAICESCDLPLSERGYVPCRHCAAMNAGKLWSGSNAFGRWLGYVCPVCHARIACERNYFSLVILATTSLIWYLPYRFYFRGREPRSPVQAGTHHRPVTRAAWVKMGTLLVGASLIAFVLSRDKQSNPGTHAAYSVDTTAVGLAIGAAIIFALAMFAFLQQRGKRR